MINNVEVVKGKKTPAVLSREGNRFVTKMAFLS